MKKIIICSMLLLLSGGVMAQPHALVRTKVAQGEIEGVLEDGLGSFKGIPFAQPPIGNLRWKAPVPASQWEGVLKADKFAPKPFQQTGNEKPGQPPVAVSEDCLYLNVLTPAKSTDEKLPVVVWIHGGGFSTGCSYNENGDNFARAGIVYVSITYRVNVFGFLSLPELSEENEKETGRSTSGNYGLMDQLLALHWIKDNVASFGGDPEKITIMGESAGAISVAILCQSPLAKGLFRAAISQSGGSMAPEDNVRTDNNSMRNAIGSDYYGTAFIERIGMKGKSLKYLREVAPEKFMGDSAAFGAGGALWPSYDGYVLPGDSYGLYQNGKYNDVNVLMGTNSDEGSMFTGFLGGFTPQDYEKEMKESFPQQEWQQKFRKMYPGATDQEAFDAHSDIFRDAAFAWPTYAWANLQSANTNGKGKVYMYHFDQLRDNPFRKGQKLRKAVSTHAFDVGFTFGHLWGPGSKSDEAQSRQMMQYWINFIKTGDPNGGYLPHWPTYQQGEETVMYFRDGAHVIDIPNKEQMNLWEEYFSWRRQNKTPLK